MSSEQLINAGAPVKVEHLTFLVCGLSVAGEMSLLARLRSKAREALGPGGLFARTAPAIDWLRSQNRHADAAALQRTTAELVATGAADSDDATAEFQRSPAGVAEELFWRTRKTHPDVSLDELQAVVTDMNALEIHLAMYDALSQKKASTPASSST